MDENAVPDFPVQDGRELAYAVAKVTLGGIPFVGGVAQEVLEQAVGAPLRRRQEQWFAQLGEALADLMARVDGLSPGRLAEDEVFLSIAARAAQQAVATHGHTKREALRNIVLNTASGIKLDDALVGTFLSYVERFSEAHLKLLVLLNNPMADPAYAGVASKIAMAGSIAQIIRQAHPDLATSQALLDRLHSDLSREGLVSEAFKTVMTVNGVRAPQTTATGDAFLRFIRTPD